MKKFLQKKVAVAVMVLVFCAGGIARAAALARTAGKAADLPPLQPAPEGVAPNYQGSVNNISNPEALPGQNGENQNSQQAVLAGQPASSQSANAASAGGAGGFVSHNKALIIVWILIAFLIGAGIYWRWGKKKNGQE